MTRIQGGLQSVDGKPIPLRAVDITGDVVGGNARIRVRQRYENREDKKLEAIYVFPLPTEATISGFVMECDGRRIEGVVKEREEAFRAYDDATLEGHGAALLEQERTNVFTATVGNLLPGETTLVEIEYVQRLHATDGALRVMIPTLVAPRYIPGKPAPERTGYGAEDPTDRVPDADRISPKIGKTDYVCSLDLALYVGERAELSSPSHAIDIERRGAVARVTLKNAQLDRDIVILAEGSEAAPVQAVAVHRQGPPGTVGTFAFSRLIDLYDPKAKIAPLDVVFVLDRSGSMGGTAIEEARKALRLCLRQLREGDHFSIIAFDDREETFAKVPFTQKTLDRADAWIAAVEARGGTELLGPLKHASEQAPDGIVVLLTDGQVGNEDEILAAVMEARKSTRFYAFGIGTNVSDALLTQLARRTGGAIELIHPGERIDDKVVATFSRAIATRVSNVRVKLVGFEADELAPSSVANTVGGAPDLVDGEPWTLFGRYRTPGRGRIEIRGTLRSEPYLLEVPIDLAEVSDAPSIEKLWAAERVRDLEHSPEKSVEGRRKKTMQDRIVAIAVAHGIASRYTSFLAIETRTGDRRVAGTPDARPIPVHAPAGWAMFERPALQSYGMPTGAPGAMPMRAAPPPPMMRASAPPMAKSATTGALPRAMRAVMSAFSPSAEPSPAASASPSPHSTEDGTTAAPLDPIFAVLSRQLASGLFDDTAKGTDEALVESTTRALIELLENGVDASDALHGELVRKAIAALLPRIAAVPRSLGERALAVAWLVGGGKRTRRSVTDTAEAVGLGALLTKDEAALRALAKLPISAPSRPR